MKKILLIIGLVGGLLYSCQNRSSDKNEDAVEKQDTINHSRHDEHAVAVMLNNGEKWIANAETTEGIKKMMTLISEFPDKPELNDYRQLKVRMETEFNTVLKKCTMKGEAHTQLHNYLLPMKAMMEDLDSADIETCREGLTKLRAHLEQYGNYFV